MATEFETLAAPSDEDIDAAVQLAEALVNAIISVDQQPPRLPELPRLGAALHLSPRLRLDHRRADPRPGGADRAHK